MPDEVSFQGERLNWLKATIVAQNNTSPHISATTIIQDLEESLLDIPPSNQLNLLSEIYMSYPTHSF